MLSLLEAILGLNCTVDCSITNASLSDYEILSGGLYNSSFVESIQKNSSFVDNIETSSTIIDTPRTDKAFNVLVISLAVPIISLTLLGNALILVVWLTHRPIRTSSNLYLISLAFADFFTALVVIPAVHSTVNRNWPYGLPACKVWLVTCLMLNTVTAFHLVGISVDRYRTVTEGVSYLQRRTFKTVGEKLGIIWVLSAWVMAPLIFDWEHLTMDPNANESCVSKKIPHWVVHFCFASFWLPAAFLIIIYHKVYSEIKMRTTLLNHRGRNLFESSSEVNKDWSPESPPTCLTSISEDDVSKFNTKDKKLASKKARERKSITTMIIISGAFVLCWLPWNCVSFYDAFLKDLSPSTSSLPPYVYTATVIIGQVNSLINPIIYAARIPEFRTALNILRNKCPF